MNNIIDEIYDKMVLKHKNDLIFIRENTNNVFNKLTDRQLERLYYIYSQDNYDACWLLINNKNDLIPFVEWAITSPLQKIILESPEELK